MSDEFEATTQHIEALKRPVVFTNGVFDLIHAGHVFCLQEARKLGSSLVVGVNSDASARQSRKGPGRPFNNELHRCRVLAEMRCVDAVFLFEEELPLALLRKVRPDIYVKGNDYQLTALAEAKVVAAWGGHTVIVPRHGGLSSSLLVNLIVGAHATASVTP
jgi:rfaE bifunctional protein nucleotidyltransferase chain/domain